MPQHWGTKLCVCVCQTEEMASVVGNLLLHQSAMDLHEDAEEKVVDIIRLAQRHKIGVTIPAEALSNIKPSHVMQISGSLFVIS